MISNWVIREASVLFHFTVVLSVVLIAIKVVKRLKRTFPPGPWGIPGLGYIPLLGKNTYLAMYEMSKKYGKIFSFTLGDRLFVVLSDPALIKRAFNDPQFSGRPMTPLYAMFDGFGLINTRGKMWRDERKFLHKKLVHFGMKKFGTGRDKMEAKIMYEVRYLMNCFMDKDGLPFDIDQYLTVLSTNVITSFLASKRYNVEDPIFQRHKRINGEGFKLFANLDLMNYIWSLRFLPSYKRGMKKLKEHHRCSMLYFKEIIQERREAFNPKVQRDILDAYLAIEHSSSEHIKNFDEQVTQVLCDMMSAGSETVKTTLNWILLFLLYRPKILAKMQEEIDEVVGYDRLPNLNDNQKLIYCQAVINEVMRISNAVPVAPNHATENDVTIDGYFIPKGSSIVALLYACHMSPEFWNKPEEFTPERFIDQHGRIAHFDAFLPFGKGLRVCLGHVIAQSEIFLVLISILQNFDIEGPPGEPLPSTEGIHGVTLYPHPYKICLKLRNHFLPVVLEEESYLDVPADSDNETEFNNDNETEVNNANDIDTEVNNANDNDTEVNKANDKDTENINNSDSITDINNTNDSVTKNNNTNESVLEISKTKDTDIDIPSDNHTDSEIPKDDDGDRNIPIKNGSDPAFSYNKENDPGIPSDKDNDSVIPNHDHSDFISTDILKGKSNKYENADSTLSNYNVETSDVDDSDSDLLEPEEVISETFGESTFAWDENFEFARFEDLLLKPELELQKPLLKLPICGEVQLVT